MQGFSHHYQPFSKFSRFYVTLQGKIKSETRKCNMSVVHQNVLLLCCTFSRKVLVTVFNLEYT